MATEVYSWRVSSDLKSELEREARLRGKPVSAVLDLAVRDWLKNKAGDSSVDDLYQQRLQEALSSCLGSIEGNDPGRAENARHVIRERLKRSRG